MNIFKPPVSNSDIAATFSTNSNDQEERIHSGAAVPNIPINPNTIPKRPQTINPL